MPVDGSLQQALMLHGAVTLALLWPALRLLRRGGLPALWALWLVPPLVGPAVFATLLAFRPWPTLPPKPEKLHSRERLRRERGGSGPNDGQEGTP